MQNPNRASLENKSTINTCLSDINKNKNFAGGLIFQLTTLRGLFNPLNVPASTKNSLEMIEKNIFEIFKEILYKQSRTVIPNQNVLTKIGEIFQEITKYLILENKNLQEAKHYFENIIDEHDLMNIIQDFIENIKSDIDISLIKLYFQLYSKLFNFFISNILSDNSLNQISLHINFLLICLHKFKDKSDILLCTLQIIESFLKNNFFYQTFFDETATYIQDIRKDFILNHIQIIKNSNFINCCVVAIKILHSLILSQKHTVKEHIDNLYDLFIPLLVKFNNGNDFNIYITKILAILLDEEVNGIDSALKFLYAKTGDSIHDINPLFKTIKSTLNNDHDKFITLQRNITKTLLFYKMNNNLDNFSNNNNFIKNFGELFCFDLKQYDILYLKNDKGVNDSSLSLIKETLPELFDIIISYMNNEKIDEQNPIVDYFYESSVKILTLFPNDDTMIPKLLSCLTEKIKKKEINTLKFLNLFDEEEKLVKAQKIKKIVKKTSTIKVDISMARTNFKEKVFAVILLYFNNTNLVYDFLSLIPFDNFYPNNQVNLKGTTLLKKDCEIINNLIKGLECVYTENELINALLYLINSLSIKFMLGNVVNYESKDSVNKFLFPEDIEKNVEGTVNKLIKQIITKNQKFAYLYNDTNIFYLINLVFSILNNSGFLPSNKEYKSNLILIFLESMNETFTFSGAIIKYFYFKLKNLEEELFNYIIKKGKFCDYILKSLDTFEKGTNMEQYFYELFLIMNDVFSQKKFITQIVKFFVESGFIYLLKIISKFKFEKDDTIESLTALIKTLGNTNFSDTIEIFQNPSMMKKLLFGFKLIKIDENINEEIYFETFSFIKKILNSTNFFMYAEELGTIQYLIQESINIFNFYHENLLCKPLLIINELIAIVCQTKKIIVSIKDSKIFEFYANILRMMKDDFNGLLFDSINFFFTSFFKNIHPSEQILKDLYNDPRCVECFKLIFEIFDLKYAWVKSMDVTYGFMEVFINFESALICGENENEGVSKERLLTLKYLQNLKQKYQEIEPSNLNTSSNNNKDDSEENNNNNEGETNLEVSKTLNSEKIQFLIQLIENPKINTKKNIFHSEENERMLRDIIALTSSKKNTNRRRTRERIEDSTQILLIEKNPLLKTYFEKILNGFTSLVKEIPKKYLNKLPIEQDNNDLYQILGFWTYFLKDENNIKTIFEKGVLENLIVIIDCNNIFSIDCQKAAFNCFEKLTEPDDYFQFISNKDEYVYFLFREFNLMNNAYSPDNFGEPSELAKQKSISISQNMALLVKYQENFLEDNIKKFNLPTLYKVLASEYVNKNLAANLISIIKQIYIMDQNKEFFSTPEQNKALCDLLLVNLFRRFENDGEVICEICEILSLGLANESMIEIMLEYQVVESLSKIFIINNSATTANTRRNRNTESFFPVLDVLEKLCKNKKALTEISEIAILPIIGSVKENTFNTKIVDKGLQIFINCSDAGYKEKINTSGMIEFLVEVLSTYSKTCQYGLVHKCLRLIELIIVLNEDYYSYCHEHIAVFMKSLEHFKDVKEIILVNMKIMYEILDHQLSIKNQRRLTVEIKPNVEEQAPGYEVVKPSMTIDEEAKKKKKEESFKFFKNILSTVNDVLSIYMNDKEIMIDAYSLLIALSQLSSDTYIQRLIFNCLVSKTLQNFKISDNENNESGKSWDISTQFFLQTLVPIIVNRNDVIFGDNSELIMVLDKILQFQKGNKFSQSVLIILKYLCTTQKNVVVEEIDIPTLLNVFDNLKKSNDSFAINEITIFIEVVNKVAQSFQKYQYEIPKRNFEEFLTLSLNLEIDKQLKVSEQLVDLAKNYIFPETGGNCQKVLDNCLTLITKCVQSQNIGVLINEIKILNNLMNYNKDFKLELKKKDIFHKGSNTYAFLEEHKKKDKKIDLLLKEYQMRINNTMVLTPMKYNNDTNPSNRVGYSAKIHSKDDVVIPNESPYLDKKKLLIKLGEKIEVELKEFLLTKNEVNFYQESGEKIRCYINFINNLKDIVAYTLNKGKQNIIERMTLDEMDSCVRSCSTAAFKKKKWNLFSKKPKAKLCFSILGQKLLDKNQKTFNVECDKEEATIKYVDYISTIIEQYKNIKMEFNA